MTFKTAKLCIEKGLYSSKEDMQSKLDIFLLGNRINEEQYQDLTQLLESK